MRVYCRFTLNKEEPETFLKSLRLIKNKKSDRFLKYYDDIFNTTDA